MSPSPPLGLAPQISNDLLVMNPKLRDFIRAANAPLFLPVNLTRFSYTSVAILVQFLHVGGIC